MGDVRDSRAYSTTRTSAVSTTIFGFRVTSGAAGGLLLLVWHRVSPLFLFGHC